MHTWQIYFSKVYHNYDEHFSRFYGPLLFLSGILRILISSFQFGYASLQGARTVHDTWRPLYKVEGLCVTLLAVICLVEFSLFALFVIRTWKGIKSLLMEAKKTRATEDHRLSDWLDTDLEALEWDSRGNHSISGRVSFTSGPTFPRVNFSSIRFSEFASHVNVHCLHLRVRFQPSLTQFAACTALLHPTKRNSVVMVSFLHPWKRTLS